MKDRILYLYGASGHAKVVLEIAEKLNVTVGGLIDSNPNIKQLLNYPVFTEGHFLHGDLDCCVISIGNNEARKIVSEKLDVEFANLLHPSSNFSRRIEIAKGTVAMAGVTVNSSVSVGSHVILNTNCSIDHDCVIGDFVHISPNVALAGNIIVGEGSHVGVGACVIQGVKIGKWCTIGAGAVVIRDVPDYSVVVGNPGRVIKMNSRT